MLKSPRLNNLNMFIALLIGFLFFAMTANHINAESVKKLDNNESQYKTVTVTLDELQLDGEPPLPGDDIDITFTPRKGTDGFGNTYFLMRAKVSWVRPSEINKSENPAVIVEVERVDAQRLRLARKLGTLGILLVGGEEEGELENCASSEFSEACFMGPAWQHQSG